MDGKGGYVMQEDKKKTKYYLMSVRTILPVESDIAEDLFNYDAQNNETEYVHRFHKIVYTIEDVLAWAKSFYDEHHDPDIEPYAIKAEEEIFFNVNEKRTIIEREITIRKQK